MSERAINKAAIRVENLIKTYKNVSAVNGVSFSVEEGELFAFLGENGAGKSTTISVICGLLQKDDGDIFISGKNIDETADLNSEIGAVFQNSVLDKALSAKENLASRAALYGIVGTAFERRLAELCDLLHFRDFINRPLSKLSGGQRRKIDVARALLHRPKILVLDEPTTGLDPQTRKTVWAVADRLRKEEKMTVFLTTHYMEEAAAADYVVILDHGKVAAEGTPRELKNKYTGDFIMLYDVTEETLRSLGDDAFLKAQSTASGYRIAVASTADATKLISAHPEVFTDYEVLKGNMDDVFLAVTGKTLQEENTK